MGQHCPNASCDELRALSGNVSQLPELLTWLEQNSTKKLTLHTIPKDDIEPMEWPIKHAQCQSCFYCFMDREVYVLIATFDRVQTEFIIRTPYYTTYTLDGTYDVITDTYRFGKFKSTKTNLSGSVLRFRIGNVLFLKRGNAVSATETFNTYGYLHLSALTGQMSPAAEESRSATSSTEDGAEFGSY
ncbi:unnamed protein product [Danaus chrysippus]|uniref:(African queen) hypothetical protein n=1 Tax=Danaus chrysippus TaxID=151541 RepID=A0A8J2R1L6_9NEOP|nr:unnamed protein product [Danaus chrysippus]